MGENQDISKIIGIIMENPDIIARIKGLLDKQDASDIKTEQAAAIKADDGQNEGQSEPAATETNDAYLKSQSKKKRRELLSALKPYVKSERAQAIDTMLSVIDVITTIKGQSS